MFKRPYYALPDFYADKSKITVSVETVMARPKGLEPLTYWFVASHSIQLSYERMKHCCVASKAALI